MSILVGRFKICFSAFFVPLTWNSIIRHSLPSPFGNQKAKEPSCPFTSKSHFSFSYEYWHHMKQVIGCVIRKVQASQNVPKENQMVKTTIKKQYDTKQNKRMADIYSLHLQWNWGSTFSVNTNIRDVHLSVRGHRWSWCQPVWGETFILRREKCTVSHRRDWSWGQVFPPFCW